MNIKKHLEVNQLDSSLGSTRGGVAGCWRRGSRVPCPHRAAPSRSGCSQSFPSPGSRTRGRTMETTSCFTAARRRRDAPRDPGCWPGASPRKSGDRPMRTGAWAQALAQLRSFITGLHSA